MKKTFLLIVLAAVFAAEPAAAHSGGWSISPSVSVGVGVPLGRRGWLNVGVPFFTPGYHRAPGYYGAPGYYSVPAPPPPVIVQQQPVIVRQQPVVVKQPAPKVRRVWIEGYWSIRKDANGKIISRTWIPGRWENQVIQ